MDDLYADLSIDEKGSSKLLTYWLAKKIKCHSYIYHVNSRKREFF